MPIGVGTPRRITVKPDMLRYLVTRVVDDDLESPQAVRNSQPSQHAMALLSAARSEGPA